MNILMIDDDQIILSAMQKMLEREGYIVDSTTDGTEIDDFMNKTTYDLIITDIMMPYISGIELLSKIKDNNDTKKIPIIIVSALDQKEVILTAFELGAEDFIKKPVNLDEVLIRVKKAIG